MKLRITVEGKTYEVEVEVLEGAPIGPTHGPTTVHSTAAAPTRSHPSPDVDPAPHSSAVTGEHVIKAPIVGTILELKVAPGDTVTINQVLLVMEAMKMETNIASPIAGKIKTILVSPGEAVKAGQVLVELE